MSVRPDFFIVGAPKCGTTALYSYLKQHPDIYFPDRKEFNYFSTDLTFPHWTFHFTPESYLEHFSGWSGEKRVGEASVWHLYSADAAENIKRFSPDAKIIVMLRNPAEMLYSLYYEFVYNGDEDQATFEAALALEESRRKGECMPRNDRRSSPNEGLFYRQVASFSIQVERYRQVFGNDRVKVILFDDFSSDAAGVYASVLEFLDLQPHDPVEFRVVNPNKKIKNRFIWKFTKFAPQGVRRVWRSLLPAKVRGDVLRYFNKRNTLVEKREPLSMQTRSMLLRELDEDITRLEEILSRDLRKWRETDALRAARE